ncbi:hypothetical protein KEM52_006546 [Ascosphaera acerosa]|nr:hypothetical protein KEM52_006546 [Ascosphaera acerosa]
MILPALYLIYKQYLSAQLARAHDERGQRPRGEAQAEEPRAMPDTFRFVERREGGADGSRYRYFGF